jgi:hypothetical protein
MMKLLKKRVEKFKNSARKLPYKIRSVRMVLGYKKPPAGYTSFAFLIDGGLGDYILAARFIRDVTAEIGSSRFDVFCEKPKIGSWIFKNIAGYGAVLDKNAYSNQLGDRYTLVLRVFCYPDVVRDDMADGKVKILSNNIQLATKNIRHIIQAHPHLDGYLGQYCAMKGWKRHNYLHFCSEITYAGHSLALYGDPAFVEQLGLDGKSYVTISNGYDLGAVSWEHRERNFSTKVYPCFEDVVRGLRSLRPDLQIIQIGDKSSKPLLSAHKSLIGQTTLPEVAALLKKSLLHIDNEGGLVHLAKAVGTDSCVIFGPTSAEYFGYEGNLNIFPKECGSCWWMEPTWMSVCVKGMDPPACMSSHRPEEIVQLIHQALPRI